MKHSLLSCVEPGDALYGLLARRGFARWIGTPDRIYLPETTDEVAEAVGHAFREGKRLAIRSGGYCAEDFVDGPHVTAVIDLARMNEVAFDKDLNAFSVRCGAILEDVNREFFLRWGVVVPAGRCPTLGVGGHITSGGYGVLSRKLGLVADYLYAVEVVTVDADGQPAIIRATCEQSDPNRDLWWAHTGGGGGTFGVVTRYWLRRRDATGSQAELLLPPAPSLMLDFSCEWPWDEMDEDRFVRLVRNHAEWCSRNSVSGTANERVYSDLLLTTRGMAHHRMIGQAHGKDADLLLDSLISEVSDGVGRPTRVSRTWMPFLTSTQSDQGREKQNRFKLKSGYRSEPLGDDQVRIIHRYLAQPSPPGFRAAVSQKSWGCRINDTAPDATSVATRNATMNITYAADWVSARDDAANDDWVRRLYSDVYQRTGGVPDSSDGAYVGYADKDLADPSLNRGAPWYELYFKHNYARLQEVKRRYDRHDFFRHGLSVRPSGPV